MKEYSLKSDNFQDIIKQCCALLKKPGAFLLVPTETVYGLACSWNDQLARQNIYQAKKRPQNKPFQMLATNIEMVKIAGGIISPVVEKIVQNFCPGPLTIVIPARNKQTIGFRIPEYDFILELIKMHNIPLAATSVNLSGEPSALSPHQALRDLSLKPDIIVDAGIFPVGSKPSTVLKVIDGNLEILRKGEITLEEINKTIN